MGKRTELPVKQRREAVLSLLRREELGVVIARRYSVSETSLCPASPENGMSRRLGYNQPYRR